jgi:hypothetical protein
MTQSRLDDKNEATKLKKEIEEIEKKLVKLK